jgi:hypothetical protein
LNSSKREAAVFERERGQESIKKWDADSNRYAHWPIEKMEPPRLILIRLGGFFFTVSAQSGMWAAHWYHQILSPGLTGDQG